MYSPLQSYSGTASPRASVLPQPCFALCCALTSVCKTQWVSSSSIFLCLFLAFTPFWVTASIPCYLISPPLLVATEMRFSTVNICPSLPTRNYRCSLCVLSAFLSINSYLFLVISVHTWTHLSICQVPRTDLQEGQGCVAKRGVLVIKNSGSSWLRSKPKTWKPLSRGSRIQLPFPRIPSILSTPECHLGNGRSHWWTDAAKRVFALFK